MNFVAVRLQPIEQKMSVYLRLDQDKVNKQHDEIVLDVFVCKVLALGALREPHPFAGRAVICSAVAGVELLDGMPTFYADGHLGRLLVSFHGLLFVWLELFFFTHVGEMQLCQEH